jgi:hypothetical protein
MSAITQFQINKYKSIFTFSRVFYEWNNLVSNIALLLGFIKKKAAITENNN